MLFSFSFYYPYLLAGNVFFLGRRVRNTRFALSELGLDTEFGIFLYPLTKAVHAYGMLLSDS